MRLSPVLVDYVSACIVWGLAKDGAVNTNDPDAAISAVRTAIMEDLMIENRLNDEVREILRERSEEMARMGVQYHDMFRMIKQELVRKRKLIL